MNYPSLSAIPIYSTVIPAKAGPHIGHSQELGILNHQYIKISDTGCGIDPKDLPHIFEPFFTKKEKGTGLGLAITQGILEKHGGTIKVESKLNQGTVFIINLPEARKNIPFPNTTNNMSSPNVFVGDPEI